MRIRYVATIDVMAKPVVGARAKAIKKRFFEEDNQNVGQKPIIKKSKKFIKIPKTAASMMLDSL
jgi:hypothetical protein